MGGLLNASVLEALKQLWRKANPNIAAYWGKLEEAWLHSDSQAKSVPTHYTQVEFYTAHGFKYITLPSGDRLAYYRDATCGSTQYKGRGKVKNSFINLNTWGGKLLENIAQKTARNVLARNLQGVRKRGYELILLVHDEVVALTERGSGEELAQLLARPVMWAPGLPLAAVGFTCDRYRKE